MGSDSTEARLLVKPGRSATAGRTLSTSSSVCVRGSIDGDAKYVVRGDGQVRR